MYIRYMKYLYVSCLFLLGVSVYGQDSLKLAERYYDGEQFLKAKAVLSDYLLTYPDNLQARLLLGKVYGHLKDWDQSALTFKDLKNSYTQWADVYYYYGAATAMQAKNGSKLKAIGKLSDIEESFKKSIALNPNHVEAHWALVTYYTELPRLFGGSLNKAKTYAADLLQISPVDGYLAYGYIYEYDKAYDQAERNYKMAYKIGGSKTTFKKLYDLYLTKLNDTEKANQLKQEFNSK